MPTPARSFRAVPALALVALLAVTADAQHPAPATEAHDAGFAAAVREWTTAPEFLSPLVDHLPVREGIPQPKDVLGYHVGAPDTLTRTADIHRYYRALADATPRVKVTTIGTTDEGREILVVFVGSEDSIANLATYRGYLRQLGDPRGLDAADAASVIAKARPIYHLMGGLHSGETGPPEMLMELVYRLAVSDAPIVREIRDRVIVSVSPVVEPDGRDRYVDWYYRHGRGITEERDRITGPPYWGKYVFHDNNRDINFSQVTTRALLDWYLEWRPPIVHDLHESVPFLYTFSGQAPQNPTLDPILYGEMPWFANFEMAQLTKYGMPGVWTHGFVDMWSPGYLAFMSSNHNGLTRMYETYGNGGPATMKRRVAGGGPGGESSGPGQTSREWYRPSPPYRDVVWSMRNNTNYMQTAVLTALQLTAQFPSLVLENFYVKSRNAVEDGRRRAPHAFVIPAEQKDRTRVALLVNLLRRQGIEVGRTRAPMRVGDVTYPAGTYLVKRDQPYGRLAKILLEKQDFPDASLRTYDDTGWTMGLALQVEVMAAGDPAVLDVPVEPVHEAAARGTVAGERGAAALIVSNHGAHSLVTFRYRLKGLDVRALEGPLAHAGITFPAGSFVIPATQAGRSVIDEVRAQAEPLGLDVTGVRVVPDQPMHDVDVPRLAVFSTWGQTQDVGWVRHALDQFEVPFDLIYKERVRAGALRAAYDVILVPNQGRTAKGLVYDIEMKGSPLPYDAQDAYPSLGKYGTSEDIRGGMGLEGVLALRQFVEEGGVLITLGAASQLPADFGLAPHVAAQRPTAAFYAPGPIVEAEVAAPSHPIFYGYARTALPVRYANGPLLQVADAGRDGVLMRFKGGADGVLSGLMRAPEEIRSRPALVEAAAGQGRIVMFAGNPCYRWQNHGEFGMLFNALLHWNDRPDGSREPSADGR